MTSTLPSTEKLILPDHIPFDINFCLKHFFHIFDAYKNGSMYTLKTDMSYLRVQCTCIYNRETKIDILFACPIFSPIRFIFI